MNKFNRASIISILLAALTACGGSGSSGNSGATTATETPIADKGNGSPSGSGTPPRTGTETPVADNGNAPGGEAQATIVLPRIYIATEGGAEVANTEDYLNATLRVVSGNGTEVMQAPTEIRGRGNTTWGMPKKPYRLKLGQAASLLGMPAERDWALLANYADKSLVRNKLAMNLGEQVGLPYNPRSRFFELYFNDTYQGVYQLFEHVKTGPDRVNVEKLDRKTDTSADIITGGYFMEIDHRLDEDVCWYTSMQIPICAKDPEYAKADIENPAHPSYAQFNYIKNYVNA
ncbi:MAG: Spore coat protein CotH, partial [Herminiimonas sp.]|nr:Spore coat protein CotH [Herminiimonas sp.]